MEKRDTGVIIWKNLHNMLKSNVIKMGNVYELLIKLVSKLKKKSVTNKIQHITVILHNKICV